MKYLIRISQTENVSSPTPRKKKKSEFSSVGFAESTFSCLESQSKKKIPNKF